MSATYSARDAARRVGTSDAAVRRAIASGRIRPSQVNGMWQLTDEDLEVLRRDADARHDARRRADEAAATSHTDAIAPPTQTDADHWRRLVEQLHRENVELAGRVGWLQAENHRLQEEVRLLKAPPATEPRSAEPLTSHSAITHIPAPDGPGEQSTAAPTHDTTQPTNGQDSASERPMRPWWKRLGNWLAQPV